jgi:hypothetical protein
VDTFEKNYPWGKDRAAWSKTRWSSSLGQLSRFENSQNVKMTVTFLGMKPLKSVAFLLKKADIQAARSKASPSMRE